MTSRPIATVRVFRTDDDKLVDEHDPHAAQLVAAAGDPIPDRYTKIPSWATDGTPPTPATAAEHTPVTDDAGVVLTGLAATLAVALGDDAVDDLHEDLAELVRQRDDAVEELDAEKARVITLEGERDVAVKLGEDAETKVAELIARIADLEAAAKATPDPPPAEQEKADGRRGRGGSQTTKDT